MNGLARLALVSLVLGCAGVALAQHSDIDVSIVTDDEGVSRVSTGISDFENPGAPIIPNVRVHAAVLNQSGIPGFTNNPGYNAFGSLPAGALLSFDIVDALRVWDPVEENFDTIPVETMQVSFLSMSRTTPSEAGGFVEGFGFSMVSGSGSMHQHINHVLGSPLTPGVYLLSLRLRVNVAGIEPSLPYFIVFNHLASMDEFSAALGYAEDVLVSPVVPECVGDLNGDGVVDVLDLSILLASFGSSDAGDLNGDGVTDVADLGILLASFGSVCE